MHLDTFPPLMLCTNNLQMNQNKRKSGAHGSKFWRETSVTSSTCARSVICDQFSITIQFITPQSVNQE